MSLNDFSNIVVSSGGAALSQVGFGTLMCAAYHTYWTDLVREFASVDEAVAAGVAVDHPVYLMLSAAFAQRPKLRSVKVGRLQTKPAVQTITITPTPVNSTVYSFSVIVDDRAPVLISITSDASATVDEIDDAIQAAIGAAALSEITVTPTGGATSTNLVLTISAGHTFAVYGHNPALLAVVDGTPGQSYKVTPVLFNNTQYALTLVSRGKVAQTVSYTSDSTATVDEICDGLQTAIIAAGVPGVTVVPDAGTATYILINGTGGRLVFLSDWDRTRLHIEDITADNGTVADLTAIRAADDDWYGLAISHNCKAKILAAAGYAETQLLQFAANTSDWQCFDSANHASGVGVALKSLSYARTLTYANGNDTGAYDGVRGLAERFPHDPGARGAGGTFHAKTLRGRDPDVLTSTEKSTLRGDNLIVYITTARTRNHTLDGKTASGEFADKIRFLDWFKIRLQERIAGVELDNDIVPYDETGLAMFEGACRAQLTAGQRTGGIAASDADGNPPTVQVPALADTETADRAARVLRNITISFRLAGAIHLVDPVNVTASV